MSETIQRQVDTIEIRLKSVEQASESKQADLKALDRRTVALETRFAVAIAIAIAIGLGGAGLGYLLLRAEAQIATIKEEAKTLQQALDNLKPEVESAKLKAVEVVTGAATKAMTEFTQQSEKLKEDVKISIVSEFARKVTDLTSQVATVAGQLSSIENRMVIQSGVETCPPTSGTDPIGPGGRTCSVTFPTRFDAPPRIAMALSGLHEGIGGDGQTTVLLTPAGNPTAEGFKFAVTIGNNTARITSISVTWIAISSIFK